MNRRALVAVVAAVAVLFAAVGWIAGQRIKSPAEVAAEQAPPEPSLLTVPVEERELSQKLVVRGTARSDESTPIEASSTSGESIITRLTKESGADLDEGDVAIEVAGRPIFVLQGELPAFRSLIPTLEGPDVKQLEEALLRLGYNPGTADGTYDGATADAVEELYRDAGYKPVEPTEQDLATLKSERQAVNDAEASVTAAQKTLSDAKAGPAESTKIQLEQEVIRAEEELTAAKAAAAEAPAEGSEGESEAGSASSVKTAELSLALAKANQKEGLATDTAEATAALKRATDSLTEARSSLADTQAVVDTQFPVAELRFLPSLPRTIQTLTVEPGERPSGPVMTVTGSGTTITSGVAASDRRLISVGDTAILEDEDLGITAQATISFIADSPGGGDLPGDRYRIRIDPDEELPEDALNVNFRITIPVTSSGGEVLAVPLAALSAGNDGTTRVEVERSPGETEIVRVSPGLKADGFVEIDVIEGSLQPGDRVVVGRDLVLPGEDQESEESDPDE